MTDDLRLSHFSATPLGAIHSVSQDWKDDYRSCYDKPKGLWVSVDGEDDWPSWCHSAMPQWMEGHSRYRISLAQNPRVLILSNPLDLDDFTLKYGSLEKYQRYYIEWPAVAADYHGLIIAPYHWSRRMHDLTSWYYGWDCASGCIWNADAIARVEEWQEAVAA